ncbi:MAG TPA: SpoIIE family protein phosphatase [Pseudonocardia sp.]|nr:SpoIIE family protein phosphatase [Pseudonocardia sp.]
MRSSTDLPFPVTGGEAARLVALRDWVASPLGPPAAWPPALCTAVQLVLESARPAALWWGPELTVVYNDAFAPLAGAGHPAALGSSAGEGLGALWATLGPAVRRVLKRGEPARTDDQLGQLLVTDRGNGPEEDYLSWAHTPVRDAAGRVLGVLSTASDPVIGARSLTAVGAFGEAARGRGDAGPRRDASEAALRADQERYRGLVALAPVGIWTTDARGVTTFVNDQAAALVGQRPPALVGAGWSRWVHPGDRSTAESTWAAAVRAGRDWELEYRLVDPDGEIRHVVSSARPLHTPDGAVSGFIGTTVDVTAQRRAERDRRAAAAEQAARQVSEAAAARLRSIIGGLNAIVWEAEWDPAGGALRFLFVSERAEELLGYPTTRWRADPDFWPGLIHAADRAEVLAATAGHMADGRDHDLVYRAVAADGRVLWLHQVTHVVHGPAGAPRLVQGMTLDVSAARRAERSAALLAEAGRVLTEPGPPDAKLAALARLSCGELGDSVVVSVRGRDGLFRRVAVAEDDPAKEQVLLRFAPTRLPSELAEPLALGRPIVVPVTEELTRAAARDEADAATRAQLDARNVLVAPLAREGRLLGLLGFANFGRARAYDDVDLDLAAELGRRAAHVLDADRRHLREQHLQRVAADLASAASVAEAAQRLVSRLVAALGAGAMTVYIVEPERGLRMVHAVGYTAAQLAGYDLIRLEDPVPLAETARTGESIWLGTREDWTRRWPHLLGQVVENDRHAAAAVPLAIRGRVVGCVGLSFSGPREFPPDEREFVLALAAQAAPAFERAAHADERRVIAETLQNSLLPAALPRLERLAFAARYLPGTRGTAAGGDWYEVLPLDGGRVAVVVGDVVGQGARAASVMGQLRSALAGYLIEGHGPVAALERLDRFAARVPGARGSTVACLVLDPGTGAVTWARAGHPPPLVVGPRGSRYLEDAEGTVLGVRGRAPYRAGTACLEPGQGVLLYTDGLVERRDTVIDEGLDRLAAAADRYHGLAPEQLADALLEESLAGSGRADDVALVVTRLLPAPLVLDLPAEAAVLRRLRAEVLAWTTAAGLDPDLVYDLQLALGEAAANAVEHAYAAPGTPDRAAGTVEVEIRRDVDGRVRVRVRDHGRWRPEPADKGYRGRGLDLIRTLGSEVGIDRRDDGTEVRFALGPPTTAATSSVGAMTAPGTASAPGPAGPPATTLRRSADPPDRCLEVIGDLDLAGVRTVREELLADLAGTLTTIDLRATSYLASAGVALLTEADRTAQAGGGRIRLLVRPGGVVRRVLALSGLDRVVEVVEEAGGVEDLAGVPAAT